MPKKANPSRPQRESVFTYDSAAGAWPRMLMELAGIGPSQIISTYAAFKTAQATGGIDARRKYATIERNGYTARIRRDGTTYTIKVKPTPKPKP